MLAIQMSLWYFSFEKNGAIEDMKCLENLITAKEIARRQTMLSEELVEEFKSSVIQPA